MATVQRLIIHCWTTIPVRLVALHKQQRDSTYHNLDYPISHLASSIVLIEDSHRELKYRGYSSSSSINRWCHINSCILGVDCPLSNYATARWLKTGSSSNSFCYPMSRKADKLHFKYRFYLIMQPVRSTLAFRSTVANTACKATQPAF